MDFTGQIFMVMIALVFVLISGVSREGYSTNNALISGSVLSALLVGLGVIPEYGLVITVGLMALILFGGGRE